MRYNNSFRPPLEVDRYLYAVGTIVTASYYCFRPLSPEVDEVSIQGAN